MSGVRKTSIRMAYSTPPAASIVTAVPAARSAACSSPAPSESENRDAPPMPISRAMDKQIVVSG